MSESVRNEVLKFRNRAGVTQEQLAEKVGVSRQTIVAIERGNYVPSVLLAIKIAKFFSAKGGSAPGGKKTILVEEIFKIYET